MEAGDVVSSVVAQAAGILGMEVDAAHDPRAIKRAYATMLKRHRPDQDPEGFRCIHDAYELLTSLAERRTEPVVVGVPVLTLADPAPVLSESPTLPKPRVDDALTQAIDRLSASAGGTEATRILAAQEVWKLACEGQHGRGLTALGTAFAQEPHLVAQVLGDEGILLAFEHGGDDLAAAILQQWTQHDIPRLADFAKGLLARMGKGDYQCALIALRVARVLSLRDPAIAEGLLNRLFLDLPPQMREAMQMVEQRVAIGRALAGLTQPARYFMYEVVEHDPWLPPPTVPAEALAALEALPSGHPVRLFLRDLMPELKLGFNWAGKGPMQVYTRKDSYQSARDVGPADSGSRMPFLLFFLVIMLVVGGLRNLTTHTPSIPRIEFQRPLVPPPNFRDPRSPFPISDPRAAYDQQGAREFTPQQREILRRLMENRASSASPSQQEQLRRFMQDPVPYLPSRPGLPWRTIPPARPPGPGTVP